MSEKDKIIYYWNQKLPYREIARLINKEFNVAYWDGERVRDKIRKYRKSVEKDSINKIIVPQVVKPQYIESNKKKIMVVVDIHYPYHREDLLDNIKKHSHEISALVIGGDAFNNDSLSKFSDISKKSFEEEIVGFYEFMKVIRGILPKSVKIILIRGNHEYRLYRYIANMHEKQLAKFINPEVIQMLVDGFTIYERTKKKEFSKIENLEYVPHWFVNINNELVVCHPEEFSKVPIKTAVNAIDYFLARDEKFSMVILGHEHKYGEIIKNNKYGVQLGCSCKPQKYADVGKFGYIPQQYSYAIVQFDENGHIDRNETRIYKLEEMYPITEQDIEYKIKI